MKGGADAETLAMRNKRVILDLVEAANEGDLERVAAAYADDYRDHTLSGSRAGSDKQATIDTFAEILRAFPGTHHVVDAVLADGDLVALRLSAQGRHEGAFRGASPSGHMVRMQTTALYRLRDGHIVERWCDGAQAIADHLPPQAEAETASSTGRAHESGAAPGNASGVAASTEGAPPAEDAGTPPAPTAIVARAADQPWKNDASGGRFRELALEGVSLTCFRLAPGTTFDAHAHASEQITWVVEGQLVFEVAGAEHRLGPGDAIAVPGHLPHRVWAGSEPVLALDAWSPPPEHLGLDEEREGGAGTSASAHG